MITTRVLLTPMFATRRPHPSAYFQASDNGGGEADPVVRVDMFRLGG